MDPYENLSEDNQVAFVELEREFRREFEASECGEDSSWLYYSAEYMNKIIAAAAALDIEGLSEFSVNTRDAHKHRHVFDDFKRTVDSLIIQIRIANARNRNAMTVGLNEAQKTKIHHLVERIRVEVEASTAPKPKKEKLFDILAKLAEEVSKDRTRYDRFADLARSLAGLSGDIEREGARPWWPWFEKIMGLIDDAKEAEPKLPKPPEVKKIEPPRKELPRPARGVEDDEIPF